MLLREDQNIVYGMSTKADGQMILHYDDQAKTNREKFFSKLNIDARNVISLKQIHGNKVKIASAKDKGLQIDGYDGMITMEPDLVLSITAADCLPIFAYDLVNETVGIAHAGWRGVLSNISEQLIKNLSENTKTDPNNIKIFIGPHMQKCHFEVKDDIIDQFSHYPDMIHKEGAAYQIDLSKIVISQLLSLGVNESNVEVSKECTFCNENMFASYRRDKPEKPLGQVAFIYIKKPAVI